MNTATRFSVGVRRNLWLTSSNLKRQFFLTTNEHQRESFLANDANYCERLFTGKTFASIRDLPRCSLVRRRVISRALVAFAVVESERIDNGP
jgi:hypothetical protein